MLFRVMSDIHNEFCREESSEDWKVPELAEDKESVLILAGDIGLLSRKQTWFGFLSQCSKQFRDVFVIEGNHGIFDDVATALDFDDKAVLRVITNLDELKKELPARVEKCLLFFPGVDRSVGGYEGLIAAQDCLPDNNTRDKFAAEYSVLSRLWEALSPDHALEAYEAD